MRLCFKHENKRNTDREQLCIKKKNIFQQCRQYGKTYGVVRAPETETSSQSQHNASRIEEHCDLNQALSPNTKGSLETMIVVSFGY